MAVKVVDTSALAALLFGEPAAAEVAGRLGAHTLAAPTLLRYELGSVLRKKRERYPALAGDLLKTIETFEALAVQEVEVPVSAMLDLAEGSGLTVYDAAYLWLSRHLRAELVTLDRVLATAAGRH